jgi:7-cyano-7-deazaguanine synthase in queuosine biosynthesis
MEKKVLLFSGGFDSLLQEWLIRPNVLLYVDMKTVYSQKEIEHLYTLPKRYQNRLIIKELPIGEYERENSYLPYRNLLLGTIGMQYGQHVYFGFNKHDDAPDKDKKFIRDINKMFEHLNKNCIMDMGWKNENYGFYAPFQDKTKTEMVALAIEKGMPVKLIQEARSCYSGVSDKGCGRCRVCFNRAVALINNGIYEHRLFDSPITEDDFIYTYKLIEDEQYSRLYYEEIKRAHRLFKTQK